MSVHNTVCVIGHIVRKEFTFSGEACDNGRVSSCKQLSWQSSRRQRCALPLFSAPFTFPVLQAVVSLPAAESRTLINAHINSHYNRVVLKVGKVLFLFLCAPRCPFCAVFVPPQCNAHLLLYCTVLWETGSLTFSSMCIPQGQLRGPDCL